MMCVIFFFVLEENSKLKYNHEGETNNGNRSVGQKHETAVFYFSQCDFCTTFKKTEMSHSS